MRILIAGDFCPRNRVSAAFEKEDYASVLSEVKELTAKSDYSIVNFECPVVIGKAKPLEKQGPSLECAEYGVKAIKYAGFDCVTLANNHFLDYGEKGVVDSLTSFDSQGMDHVGGGMNVAEASNTLYKDINGKRLAVINCCEHEFSIATTTTAGSNPLNPIRQYYAIMEAQKNADCVLVVVHGGHEHFQLPSLRMVETYRFFIDAGADAVVNHHQHCYSGYEVYKGKPIFYGLGNFCFDGNMSGKQLWHEGYMVSLNFEEQVSFDILPYTQCGEEPKVSFTRDNAFDERIKKLNNIIANPVLLEGAITGYYEKNASNYSVIFEPCNNRSFLALKRRGWLPSLISKKRKLMAQNYIECEAHRDKLLYYFHNN